MLSKDNDFHLNRQCQITDVNCWKNEFEKNMNCLKSDTDCWKGLIPRLPCDIEDVECWKKSYPDIPCEFHDKECWRTLLPELPCKLIDKECWSRIRDNQNQKDISFKNMFKDKELEQQYDNTIEESFDRYINYGFGII